ncbi:MAG TPA: sigma-54 dependent transcriptional regulator [Kofleriaceae bacterium]|nr:sigma-54 dependent transcriptional regulator [Kofleriaceae bacterium]
MRNVTALVVDGDVDTRSLMCDRLKLGGCSVEQATTGGEALAWFGRGVDVALVKCTLSDGDGIDLIGTMRRRDPRLAAIAVTEHAAIAEAVRALQAGACHYLGVPQDIDDVPRAIEHAVGVSPRARVGSDTGQSAIDQILGESPAIVRVKRLIARIARSPASTVLITGESGTGKDLTARAIHALSDRASKPFVNVTCSALPEQLLESELYGHERGAFTDARSRKNGLFEHADGGTVFLDEIGEMSPALQAKLLRFLEEHTFRRVGGTGDIKVDVRVVAATNVDLRSAVARGAFRSDLYYRLAVLTVALPALRERPGDVDLLVARFAERFARDLGCPPPAFDDAAIEALRSYPWPGNIRELKNAVERALFLSDHGAVRLDELGISAVHTSPEPDFELPAGGIDVRKLEESLVRQALARAHGNQTHAARLLGMNRDQIRYRITKLGL